MMRVSRRSNSRACPKANAGRSVKAPLNRSNLEKWTKLARKARFQPSALAGLCSVSLRQMERFFAWHFRKTPSRWLRECRCRLARQLISKGFSSRTVIGQLNFVDHSHLCHEFEKIYGATPQSFAPKAIKRKAAGLVRVHGPLMRTYG